MTTAPLPLSRSCTRADFAHVRRELQVIDAHGFVALDDPRRWEYALTLHAIERWLDARGLDLPTTAPLYDAGASPVAFVQVLSHWTQCPVVTLDCLTTPLVTQVHSGRQLADIVIGLSLLEHVADLDRCLYALTCLLAPGGLLVLTVAYWDRCGADTAHDHETRARIFCPKKLLQLRGQLRTYHCDLFGGFDATYHGPQIHDYSVASLVLEKRR